MAQLDELKVNTLIRGLLPGNHPVLIVSITIHAGIGAELVYKDSSGQLGKEEDFQLFMALLDPDRFEGRFRNGVHKVDVSNIMRHLVKEQLRKFDGSHLFPERFAYTVNYRLSPAENDLYRAVTNYIRQEFNRADALHNNGRKGTIGFALTILHAAWPPLLKRSISHCIAAVNVYCNVCKRQNKPDLLLIDRHQWNSSSKSLCWSSMT